MNVVAAFSPLFGLSGVICAGLYTEIWTGEMIRAFRNSAESLGWVNKIRSVDSYVADNNTVHFVDLGGDPSVLVNNTTYPIGIENLTDTDKAIGLDKYQTKATRVTDDEIRGLSYDKKSSVIERHMFAMEQLKYARALHALAPDGDTAGTPVILTSGSATGGRKALTLKDIVELKYKFDTAKVPTNERVLVLCPDHVSDLLLLNQAFANQFYNYQSGKPMNMFGFELYEYVDCPYYTVATKVKVPFGSTPGAGDNLASVAFYAPRMIKATGETKAYIDEPGTQSQEWHINYRHYFICLPLKLEALGAIVSGV